MFTITMTPEEIYKEALSESYTISTQASMFYDSSKNKYKRVFNNPGYYRKAIKTKK